MRVGNRAARLLLFLFITAAYLIPPSETARLHSKLGPGAVFTVTNSNDSGAGSFRQAIINANAATGTDTIQFQIGSGPVNINLSTSLPDITEPLIIDGTTQPGFSGTPLIRLAGNFTVGLKITGGGSTIKAVATTGFTHGIVFETAGNNILTGSFIGICPQNPTADCRNFGNGVLINNSSNNQIGGATVADRNIIGGNSDNGVVISGSTSSGNIIVGNYIGLLTDDTVKKNEDSGIFINGAPNNRVGGTTAGERNIISGNGFDGPFNQSLSGVLISGPTAAGNIIEGNYIGTKIDGMTTADNSDNNGSNAVRIEGAADNRIGGVVGTTPGGACTGACNVISGNRYNGGVVIIGSSATGNSVLGNFIGTNAVGTGNVSNNRGVTITAAAANNTVGGTVPAARNLITNGMIITAGAATNTVHGNYIGTDTTGNIAIGTGTLFPSLLVVVGIDSSPNNIIGTANGTTLGGACTGGCNVISGNNAAHGVFITGAGSTGNRVDYNYIGLNAAGTTALRNGGDAITLRNGANNNIIGRPLKTAPFQAPKACLDTASLVVRCVQDDTTGDWIQFDDATGEYTWSNCRGGVTMSGVGEVRLLVSEFTVELQAAGIWVGIDIFAGRGSSRITPPPDSLLKPFLIQDSNVPDSTCVCPTEGMQTILGTVTNGTNNDPNPPSNNKYNFLSLGWDARGAFRLSDPVSDGYFRNLSGGFDTYTNLDIATNGGNSSPISVRSGTDIFLGTLKINALDPGIYVNLPVDIHDDGIVNPPVPQPGPGANRSYNSPQNLSVRLEANGAVRVKGTLHMQQGSSSRLGLRGVEDLGGGMKAVFNNEHRFDVVSDANGDATIDRLYTGADAFALKQSDYLAATATRINQVPITSENAATSFVEVLGDTSEFSLPAVVPQPKFDFDEDGKTDIAVYRPGTIANAPSYWYILNSSDFSFRIVQFGNGEDIPVAGDYQGDGVADFAVFRTSTGTWYNSRITGDPSTNFVGIQWGVSTDIPVPGDYDDDGANDAAIFRPSDGTWWIRRSIDESFFVQQWGLATDKPVPADYDGDGDTDIAVYRNGTWYISLCPSCPPVYSQFGLAGDVPVPGDYDGDGRDDVAVWRPSTGVWYLQRSTAGFAALQFGLPNDKAVAGDFDADGKTDIAIWRPSEGNWYVLRSEQGFLAIHWGQNGDIPAPMFPNQ